jgi:hypothetical protein
MSTEKQNDGEHVRAIADAIVARIERDPAFEEQLDIARGSHSRPPWTGIVSQPQLQPESDEQ